MGIDATFYGNKFNLENACTGEPQNIEQGMSNKEPRRFEIHYSLAFGSIFNSAFTLSSEPSLGAGSVSIR